MKFEEFKKYKKIAESKDPQLLGNFPDAAKIYQWMEDNDRIDEGFWGAVWSWLKRNFSITARRLHSLADEYEQELTAEIQAEYGKLKDAKDLNSKFRRSFAGRIAEDIEDKMELIAADDDDYRELVRTLINKKKLKVKKKMLQEFSGRMDPEDVGEIDGEIDGDLRNADSAYERAIKKISRDKQEIFREASKELSTKISSEKSKYNEIGYDTTEKVQKLVQLIIYYQNALSEQGKEDLTTKSIQKTLANFYKFVIEGAKKLERGSIKKDEAVAAIIKATEYYLKSEKPQPLEKLGAAVFKMAEDDVKGKGTPAPVPAPVIDKVEDEVTTEVTPVVMTDKDVDKTITTAASDTGEDKPKVEDIVKEIEDSVKTYFDTELPALREELSTKVDAFNSMKVEDREKKMEEFGYKNVAGDKIPDPTVEDMKSLFSDLTKVAGAVVPYFGIEKGKRSKAFYLIINFMFEIFAIKKNTTGTLTSADIDLIAKSINQKYAK